jgi:putative two-component system response regulator
MCQESEGSVVIVDDEPALLQGISMLLGMNGFTVRSFDNGVHALAFIRENPPDAVVTDVNMPRMNGLELLEQIRSFDKETPVILISGAAELDMAFSAIRLKTFEFITKPFQPEVLTNAVARAVDYKRLLLLEKNYKAELEQTVVNRTCELVTALENQRKMSSEVIERLATASELRDEDTGLHNARIGLYAGFLARELSMPHDFIENVTVASVMHDIGKIGIPDAILFKTGRLNRFEYEIIKTHTLIGEQILRGASHPLLQTAAAIALTHHERWDGTGYPQGLQGENIPLAGRIVMLADQYDALRSRRAYKLPYDHETACSVILEGDGQTSPEHFDPEVLRIFKEKSGSFAEIFDADRERSSAVRSISLVKELYRRIFPTPRSSS